MALAPVFSAECKTESAISRRIVFSFSDVEGGLFSFALAQQFR